MYLTCYNFKSRKMSGSCPYVQVHAYISSISNSHGSVLLQDRIWIKSRKCWSVAYVWGLRRWLQIWVKGVGLLACIRSGHQLTPSITHDMITFNLVSISTPSAHHQFTVCKLWPMDCLKPSRITSWQYNVNHMLCSVSNFMHIIYYTLTIIQCLQRYDIRG